MKVAYIISFVPENLVCIFQNKGIVLCNSTVTILGKFNIDIILESSVLYIRSVYLVFKKKNLMSFWTLIGNNVEGYIIFSKYKGQTFIW